MSASKAKGTRWESAIVFFLHLAGWSQAERRTLNGAKDKGDISGIPGVVIEAKNQNRLSLAEWVDEAEREAGAAGDESLVAVCDDALAGDVLARARCVEVINDAASMAASA